MDKLTLCTFKGLYGWNQDATVEVAFTLQANPGGTNVEVLDEQAPDSTAVVDEAVRVFEKREVRHSHGPLVCARCWHTQVCLQVQAPGKWGA